MAYLIGTDEAGYGPNLGPLVISATVWEVPDDVGGENLFDRLYYDYLSPPAAATPPGGSLLPGARIPGPGRGFLLTVRYRGR